MKKPIEEIRTRLNLVKVGDEMMLEVSPEHIRGQGIVRALTKTDMIAIAHEHATHKPLLDELKSARHIMRLLNARDELIMSISATINAASFAEVQE